MTTPEKLRRTITVRKNQIPHSYRYRTVEVHEKQKRAADLRTAGVKYSEIAESLGYANAGGAKKAVDAYIRRQDSEIAKEVILLDLVRLDEYQMRCSEALRRGDLAQVDRLMRIMEMRYKLVGVSSRTVEELQQRHGVDVKGGGMVNNGVMVIQGSSGDFVRSMMIAAGADPEDPQVQEKMKQIEEAQARRSRTVQENEKLGGGGTLPDDFGGLLGEEEIVDAEIVEDD